jgi:peptidoglycan/LPS O-acetylase OafA/YrhL
MDDCRVLRRLEFYRNTLAGMVALFAFEFIEGNTVTRFYFMRLRRLSEESLAAGTFTPDLIKARTEHGPTFTHFLDLPILFLIVTLGVLKPDDWRLFFAGLLLAFLIAAALMIIVPRLCPQPDGNVS